MGGFNSIFSDIVKFLTSLEFTAIINILSIIGLIINLFVFLSIRKIRDAYLFAARVPDLIKKLKKSSSQISTQMNDFEHSLPQIRLELASIEVILNSLRNKVSGGPKRSTGQLLKSVKIYRQSGTNKDELWSIYVSINKLLAEIADMQEDKKWEKQT